MKYRIAYETTASIVATVEVPDDLAEDDIDDYVSETAHEVIEAHLSTIDGHYAGVFVSVDATIDGDAGSDIEPVT